jgi:hypothetical protein
VSRQLTSAATGVRRALLALAVAVGVLAMHGVVTTHHAAERATSAGTSSADSAVAAMTRVTTGAATMVHAAPATATGMTDRPCMPGCSDQGHGALMLCVALLSTAAIAVLLALTHTRERTATALRPPRLIRPGRTATARRVDVVAELCTSRT